MRRRATAKGGVGPREVVLEYASEATLHGVRYLASDKVTASGKMCWLAAMLACGVCAGVFVHTAWLQYRNSPTRTSVESTNFPLHRLAFPAVTVCPSTKVRRSVGEKLLASHLNITLDSDTQEKLWNIMSALSLHEFPFHFRMTKHLVKVTDLLPSLDDLNITQFMLEVLPPIEKLFKDCFWQGVWVNCSTIFSLQRYEAGFCYAFNSLTTDTTIRCPPVVQLAPSAPSSVAPENNCTLKRNVVSGTTTGLELFFFGSAEEDGLGKGQRDVNGIRLLVHHPLQFPEAGKGLLLLEQNDTVLTVRVSVAVTESSASLRSLSPNERHCYFADEWRLEMSATYSQKNCLLECRLHHITQSCQCVPYFFNLVPGWSVCNMSSLSCVARIDTNLRFLRLQAKSVFGEEKFLDCSHCLPTCHDTTYELNSAISKDSNPLERSAYVDVFYADLSAVKYYREVAFDAMQLIVSFGGIAGLFLGVSLLSCVELLYYLAVLLHATLCRRRDTIPVARRDVRKVWHVMPLTWRGAEFLPTPPGV